MNMPGAPMMRQNPYAHGGWLRNTPTAHGKRKLFRALAFAQDRAAQSLNLDSELSFFVPR
jgi:hypothetical protein